MWRKIHFWIGLVIVIQVVFWLVSGMGFSIIYDRALGGERETRNLEPPSLSVADVRVAARQIPELLRYRFGHPVSIRSLALQSHNLDGRPVYVVGIEEADQPVIVDAKTGRVMNALSGDEAKTIAQRDFTGSAPVESIETITRPYQKGYDYFGELPVYRVNFANWKSTRIYVSPITGEIRLRRNIDKTLFDVFWTLHMFGYVDHNIGGNPGLIATGLISLVLVATGITLYVPFIKRKLGLHLKNS
jgi:uncharacterized iron-regulated membrane protein